MGWNQPKNSEANTSDSPQNKTKAPLVRGLVAAVIVVAGAVCCWHFLTSKTQQATDPKKETKQKIADVASSKATLPQSTEKARQELAKDTLQSDPTGKVARIRKQQAELAKVIARKSTRPKAPYAIFKHPSENRIAGLLMCPPGTPVLVPPNYSHRFVEDFKKSCQEPIVINQEDSDYVKGLKQSMIDCKIDLCNRMAKGEALEDILSSAHLELQKLSQFKQDIEWMVREEIRTKAQSAEDVDSYIDAANRLLESKGIAPIRDNPVVRRNFLHMTERKNSETGK